MKNEKSYKKTERNHAEKGTHTGTDSPGAWGDSANCHKMASWE